MGGFFGVAKKDDCINDLFYGTDYHSHLGTRRGGMAVKNHIGYSRSIHNIENNYFRSKFEQDLPKFDGNLGVGVISDTDPQPLIVGSHLGTFAAVTVGKIHNMQELEKRALEKRLHFSEKTGGETCPTELVSMLICEEDSFEKGLEKVQEVVKGSLSILLLTENGVYAARDKLGRTPVVIGRNERGYAAASESCAFPNLGYETDRFLGPGEIVFMTPDGCEQVKKPGERMQVCAFLWIYYGYPASEYEGINAEYARNRCGEALADNDDIDIDFVSGIPDSGIGHALGYAGRKCVPYERAFVKYTPTWPRSFMPQHQNLRDLVAKMKLIPVRKLIEGKRILFCEDSIVRGTQLRGNVQLLFDVGAREVHMRVACPTLLYPCEFLNFSTSRSTLDLAGRKVIDKLEGGRETDIGEYAVAGNEKNIRMVDEIRKKLKLTSLKYQKIEDMVNAIGLPKKCLCTHCWDGSSYF